MISYHQNVVLTLFGVQLGVCRNYVYLNPLPPHSFRGRDFYLEPSSEIIFWKPRAGPLTFWFQCEKKGECVLNLNLSKWF